MNKIFVITGETGRYENFIRWNVAAFLDENQAKEYLNKLNEALIKNGISLSVTDFNDVEVSSFPLDEKMLFYWCNDGVEYQIEEVKVLDNE